MDDDGGSRALRGPRERGPGGAGCRYVVRDAAPEADRPHRRGLLDAPLGRADLRVDCDEHEPIAG